MTRLLTIPHPRQRAIHDFRRRWLVPVLTLTSLALVVFFGFYTWDHLSGGGLFDGGWGAWRRYRAFDPDHITDAVSSLAGMIAAVFGIVITVVSIVVQLSADRFTGVARMFLRDRINTFVMGFYVITCVCGVWLSVTLKTGFVPGGALLAMLCGTTLGLVLMAPYFGYVFWFLEPQNIVQRIRVEGMRAVVTGLHRAQQLGARAAQARVVSCMEELTDVTSNSISGKDKIIASAAVDALKDFALDYLKLKQEQSAEWFRIGERLRENPDFVAMDPESLSDIEQRRTWVEWKVMRQYLGIYNEALVSMRDINYLIAIDTRYIGEAAAGYRDMELLRLVFRYMNSYLRTTINARDVRTAYNILNQYRLLVESMLRQGHDDLAMEAAGYLNYYGHVCFDIKLTFVTETIAYDVSALCQLAHELNSPCRRGLLQSFLELDRPLRARSQEAAVLGVRKAQVKLAAYFLSVGAESEARLVEVDMRDEPLGRLESIRYALESVTTKDFWEIIDRGRNFEYMPEAQRNMLPRFFEWLGVGAASYSEPPPSSSAVISSLS